MLDKNTVVYAGNVGIVQSQDSYSLGPFTITDKDFFAFTGDRTQTVTFAPFEVVHDSQRVNLKKLFGSWIAMFSLSPGKNPPDCGYDFMYSYYRTGILVERQKGRPLPLPLQGSES